MTHPWRIYENLNIIDLDCLFEGSRLSFHILSSLRRYLRGEIGILPHFHSALDSEGYKLIECDEKKKK
jgi:hypothetical protein